ncbi:hypothetical protein [Streptomyces sp. NPDC002851]
MKIITAAALAAATLVLTAAVPASAAGDHGINRADQQGSPSYVANSGNSDPMKIGFDADANDLNQGILPVVGGLL